MAEGVATGGGAQRRFLDVVLAYVLTGDPGGATPYDLDEGHLDVARRLSSSLKLFVVAHEYEHMAAGYLAGAAGRAAFYCNARVVGVSREEGQELEADALAVAILLQIARQSSDDLAMGLAGIALFFACADVLERAWSVLNTGAENHARGMGATTFGSATTANQIMPIAKTSSAPISANRASRILSCSPL